MTLEEQIAELQKQIEELQRQVLELRSPVVRTLETFDLPIPQEELEPLDSPVVWKRRRNSMEPGGTHEILSLIMEDETKESFPWPLYIRLTTHQDKGDAVGATVRQFKHGNGWDTAIHIEPFLEEGTGTMIGVNLEPRRRVDTGRCIGINIQSNPSQSDGSTRDTTMDEAINIQGGESGHWKTGIHFDQGSNGTRALWLEGEFVVGIDMGNNAIRMNKGAELIFEETGRFYMKYNPDSDRIEFHNRTSAQDDQVIGYIPAGASEHEL